MWRNCQIEDILFDGKIFIDPWNLLKIQHTGVWFFWCITNSFNACLFVCELQEEISEFSRSPTQGEWRQLDGVKESQTGREVPWSFAWQVNELCHCIFPLISFSHGDQQIETNKTFVCSHFLSVEWNVGKLILNVHLKVLIRIGLWIYFFWIAFKSH